LTPSSVEGEERIWRGQQQQREAIVNLKPRNTNRRLLNEYGDHNQRQEQEALDRDISARFAGAAGGVRSPAGYGLVRIG